MSKYTSKFLNYYIASCNFYGVLNLNELYEIIKHYVNDITYKEIFNDIKALIDAKEDRFSYQHKDDNIIIYSKYLSEEEALLIRKKQKKIIDFFIFKDENELLRYIDPNPKENNLHFKNIIAISEKINNEEFKEFLSTISIDIRFSKANEPLALIFASIVIPESEYKDFCLEYMNYCDESHRAEYKGHTSQTYTSTNPKNDKTMRDNKKKIYTLFTNIDDISIMKGLLQEDNEENKLKVSDLSDEVIEVIDNSSLIS